MSLTRAFQPSRSAIRTAASVLLVFAASAALAAPAPDPQCRGAKLKAAGKYASALLGCSGKAAKDDVAVDGQCVGKADTKFTEAFATAETKSGVDCNGLDVTTSSIVEETAADVEAAAPVPSGGGDCVFGVRKAGGKFASSVLGAWSKFATVGDATKRDAAIAKARTTLATKITKAELASGCVSTGQGEAVRVAVEDGLAPLFGCLGSAEECVEQVDEVVAGGTATTDPGATGPDADVPVTAGLETPNAGTVVLRVIENTEAPPAGFEILGRQIDITAPPASAAAPLVLTFVIEATLLPVDTNSVVITRDGVLVVDCTGAPGVADPDPCVQSRTVLVPSGDLELVVLSSHASLWTPLVQVPLVCPGKMLWELRADDTGDDRATEIDVGWKGLGHDFDPASGSAMTFGLDCSSATNSDCGLCNVTGFDALSGTCRCASDSRIACDEPLVADADDCGGSVCQCYVRAPSPVNIGGTPACLVSVAAGEAGGTWDPDTGSGDVVLSERVRVHTGISQRSPCPSCDGDATPGDGVRGGTCSGGQSAGLGCDANAGDPTYPMPGGGFYSLDCMPNPGGNLTGSGLLVSRTETTGTSTLTSSIPCAGGSGSCPCAVCSGNTSIACSSDAQCASASAGLCNSTGGGTSVEQNACSGGSCVLGPDNDGECDLLFQDYCDGATEEDGRGIIACSNNMDCDAFDCDGDNLASGGECGACTLTKARDCFGSTISATGLADPAAPRTVAATCLPPTGNGSVDNVLGLPGPGRVRTDWFVTLLP